MALEIEELRRQKERLEKEKEEVDRQLADAERREREAAAGHLVDDLREITGRIDGLKDERQKLLLRIREAAPRMGDFSYAADDWRLTLHASRGAMKQPELLDRLLRALSEANLHVEPRTPKFRLFRGLRPVGLLQVAAKRLAITAIEPILDPELIAAVRALDAQFPGLVHVELASVKKERRVRAGFPARLPDGDYALSITFTANDTGSLDAVLPLALRALDHVAAYWERWTQDEEARIFEPWTDAPGATAAPVEEKAVEEKGVAA